MYVLILPILSYPFLLFIFLFFLISSLIQSTLPSFFSFAPLGPSGLDVLPFFTLTSEHYRHTLARLEHQLLDAASCHQDMNAIIQLKAVRTEVGDPLDGLLLLLHHCYCHSPCHCCCSLFAPKVRSSFSHTPFTPLLISHYYQCHLLTTHTHLYILSYSRWCYRSLLRCFYP